MAKIIRRIWTAEGPTGKRVRHVAFGYTLMVNRKQERKVSSAWLTESDALAELAQRQAAIAAGKPAPAQKTLVAVVAEYLAHKANEGKRSLEDDRLILERKVVPALGRATLVRTITAGAIARYAKDRLGQVKPGTVANELSVLRHLLHLAHDWDYIDAVPRIKLPKRSEGRLRYLEPEEIGRLLAAGAESRNPYLRTIMIVALNTGMRQQEILGLEWERIDLSSARITLYQTKSGKPRGIPINRDVYEALIALEGDAAKRTGLLFTGRDGGAWGKIRTAFELALKRAGVKDFTFHDLRHTFASHAIMRGVSLADLKEILGHSTITMTLRYAHLSPTHLRAAVEKVEGLTGGAPAPSASAHESAQGADSPEGAGRNLR